MYNNKYLFNIGLYAISKHTLITNGGFVKSLFISDVHRFKPQKSNTFKIHPKENLLVFYFF